MEKEIIKILLKYSTALKMQSEVLKDNDIEDWLWNGNFDDVAIDIIKLFAIPDVSTYFSFVRYVNEFYEYFDNTEKGDIYENVVTKKILTEQQIFDEWKKQNKIKAISKH